MARIRTARVIAAAASVPLAFVLMGGVAQADNGSFAGNGSNSAANGQAAVGNGANTNQANNANVNGDGAVVDQDNQTVNNTVTFNDLW
ncbi:hypothetical protein [Streptomyces sp. ODS28]|uniref:hypothetical protein n=1 Tax=Streptomyces sp. ODS28 TaxID=3136688 RepID=UPI0031E80BCB